MQADMQADLQADMQASNNIATYTIRKKSFCVPRTYDLKDVAGKGAFGTVARFVHSETTYAIKKLDKDVQVICAIRELDVLKHLRNHELFVNMHFEYFHDDSVYMIFENMDSTLGNVIRSAQTLTPAHVIFIAHQIFCGVAILHDAGILHRDLKPDNILINGDCKLKIADFGMSRGFLQESPPKRQKHTPRQYSDNYTTGTTTGETAEVHSTKRNERFPQMVPFTSYQTTRWYRAPEILLETTYDAKADVWSCACIIAELVCRHAILCGKDSADQMRRILRLTGKPSVAEIDSMIPNSVQRRIEILASRMEYINLLSEAEHHESILWHQCKKHDSQLVDLFKRLFQFVPSQRISAYDASRHSYLKDQQKLWRSVPAFNTGADTMTERQQEEYLTKNVMPLETMTVMQGQMDEVIDLL